MSKGREYMREYPPIPAPKGSVVDDYKCFYVMGVGAPESMLLANAIDREWPEKRVGLFRRFWSWIKRTHRMLMRETRRTLDD